MEKEYTGEHLLVAYLLGARHAFEPKEGTPERNCLKSWEEAIDKAAIQVKLRFSVDEVLESVRELQELAAAGQCH